MDKTLLKIFDSIALASTLFLLVVVAFNIIARQVHDVSNGNINFMIQGAVELSKYALLIIVFSALPRAITQGMVRVDLLSERFPQAFRHFLNKLWLILIAGFTSILVWLFSQKALLTFSRGDATQDLQIPLFYIYSFISLACMATTIACLYKISQGTTQKETR
ncbi:MAG TPA: TRAP transporter small permease [Leucothrix sp.]|nr:TRAP transporter small permease [Leucothrix sp.]